MSTVFLKFGKTRTGTSTGNVAPRLTLAAFGKHPGWDDHMPGIGLETETLAYIKQSLYVTGIGRQIDSGAWEKLEPDKRQDGFDHTFFWLRADHLILGLIWSSKDGKGRSKYPMVLCVDSEGVPASVLLSTVLPGLEALREACKADTSAEQVASHCRAAQEELRKLFAGGTVPSKPVEISAEPRRFLERAELGPDRLGLLRVLHELSGSFGAASETRPSAQGTNAPTPSLHLRVPLAADSQNSALMLWAKFLCSTLPPDVPLLLVVRGQADWLDVVVGEPKADDFFFLQASQKGFPLATQIPYELAPQARQRLREVEVRFQGEETSVPETVAKVPPPLAPTTLKVPAPTPPPLTSRVEKPALPSKGHTGLIVGGVVVVLIAALVVWLLHGHPEQQGGPQHDIAVLPDPYQTALTNSQAAFARSDFTLALAEAGKALSIKPDDADAKRLRDEAQAKLDASAAANQKEADYQLAMKNGRAALAQADYAKAVVEADKALALKTDNAEARQLRDNAQAKLAAMAAANQKESAYQSAIKNARAAFSTGDYTTAIAGAVKALSIKPDDADARHLRDDAQTKIGEIAAASQKEADYQTAMKDGRAAMTRGDYASALTQAEKALSIKADDIDAKQLRDGAQAKLAEMAQASQKESDYRAAMVSGRGAFARGDYAAVEAEANKALALKPDDADAKLLRDEATQKLSGAHAQLFTNSIQMVFVWLPGVGPGGVFMGKYEVTEQQFQTIMGSLPNGQTVASATLPVEGVTFQDATQFCEKLSEREHKNYTLPTRQQWLSAAGLSEDKVSDAWNILSASGALDHEATSRNEKSPRTTPVPVGSMGAQTNGVCDMFGNVREWVSEKQRAGFSYSSNGVARKGQLFFPDQESDATWIEPETGLRCVLQESPPH